MTIIILKTKASYLDIGLEEVVTKNIDYTFEKERDNYVYKNIYVK